VSVYAGWKEALEELGLEASEAWWFIVTIGRQSTESVACACSWRRRRMLTPFFASSDQIALGAMGIAHQLGLRLPQDLAIVGFDNTPEAAFFWPPLTTMYQQLIDVGRIAVKKPA